MFCADGGFDEAFRPQPSTPPGPLAHQHLAYQTTRPALPRVATVLQPPFGRTPSTSPTGWAPGGIARAHLAACRTPAPWAAQVFQSTTTSRLYFETATHHAHKPGKTDEKSSSIFKRHFEKQERARPDGEMEERWPSSCRARGGVARTAVATGRFCASSCRSGVAVRGGKNSCRALGHAGLVP